MNIFTLPTDLKHKIFYHKKQMIIQEQYDIFINHFVKQLQNEYMNIKDYFYCDVINCDSPFLSYNVNTINGETKDKCLFENFEINVISKNQYIYHNDFLVNMYNNDEEKILKNIYSFYIYDIIINKDFFDIIKKKYQFENKDLTEINKLIDADFNNSIIINSLIEESDILHNVLIEVLDKIRNDFEEIAKRYNQYNIILHKYNHNNINKNIDLLKKVNTYIKNNFIDTVNEDIRKYLDENNKHFSKTKYETFIKYYDYFINNKLNARNIFRLFYKNFKEDLDIIQQFNFNDDYGFEDSVFAYFIEDIL